MTNNNENDKKENAADAKSGNTANGSADKANNPKNSEAKDKLTAIANKAGALATKAFAAGKAATKDVVQELKNVNDIRKETVATAAEGSKKTDLAKGFWTKISGKQKAIIVGIAFVFMYVSYSAVFSMTGFEKFAYEGCVREGKYPNSICTCNAANLDKTLSGEEKQNYKSAALGDLAASFKLMSMVGKLTGAIENCAK
jgi:hypothetical protein